MVNAYLTQPPEQSKDTESFVRELIEGGGLRGVGGFSLFCGRIGNPLAVISNRTPKAEEIEWILKERNETVGLSNAAFGDRSWPKVLQGESLMSSAIADSLAVRESKEELVERLMTLLSIDTMPKRETAQSWDSYVKELRKSIFIPALGGEGANQKSADDVAAAKSDQQLQGLSGIYGTQKQTVVLVDHHGQVTFVERTLHQNTVNELISGRCDRWFVFDIEAWQKSENKGV